MRPYYQDDAVTAGANQRVRQITDYGDYVRRAQAMLDAYPIFDVPRDEWVEVCRGLLGLLTDATVPDTQEQTRDDPDGWVRELLAAGWVEVRLHVWRAPDGELYRGPFGAWRKMRAMARLSGGCE